MVVLAGGRVLFDSLPTWTNGVEELWPKPKPTQELWRPFMGSGVLAEGRSTLLPLDWTAVGDVSSPVGRAS